MKNTAISKDCSGELPQSTTYNLQPDFSFTDDPDCSTCGQPDQEVTMLPQSTTYNLQPDFSFTDNPDYSTCGQPAEEVTMLPVWGLSSDLQRVIDEVTRAFQCHRDYAVASMMVAASTMMGKRVSCRFGEFTNHACLWIQLIGSSVRGKSGQLSFFFKPIEMLERDSYYNFRQRFKQWKDKEPKSRGDEPIYRHRLLYDTTNENLFRELSFNGDMCICNDEMASTVLGWARYSKGDDGTVKKMLSIFDNKDTQIARVSSEPLMLQEPNLNMIGGIQPDVFNVIMGGHNWEFDGFFQRFLYVFPELTPKLPYQEYSITTYVKWLWNSTIDELAHIDSMVLTETDEAKKLHIEALNRWVDEINACNGFSPTESLLGKLSIHLCRWSIVAAVLARQKEITAEIMKYSIECMEYFKRCGEKALLLIINNYSNKQSSPQRRPIRLDRSDVFKMLQNWYEKDDFKINQSLMAKSLGISQQAISKFFK